MNRYAPPALSPRLIPVMRRHFLVWRKLALPLAANWPIWPAKPACPCAT